MEHNFCYQEAGCHRDFKWDNYWGGRTRGGREGGGVQVDWIDRKSTRYSRSTINSCKMPIRWGDVSKAWSRNLTRRWTSLDSWRRKCQGREWILPPRTNMFCKFSIARVVPSRCILAVLFCIVVGASSPQFLKFFKWNEIELEHLTFLYTLLLKGALVNFI